jgi:hypothetical protein
MMSLGHFVCLEEQNWGKRRWQTGVILEVCLTSL